MAALTLVGTPGRPDNTPKERLAREPLQPCTKFCTRLVNQLVLGRQRAIERATRSRADAMTAVNGQKRHQHGKPSYRQRKGTPVALDQAITSTLRTRRRARFTRCQTQSPQAR